MTLLDAIHAEIADETGDPRVVVTGYALLVQFINGDGEPLTYTDTPEDQRSTATLGMLVAGAVTEAAEFMRQNREP